MALDNLNSFILFILCLHDMYFLQNFTFLACVAGVLKGKGKGVLGKGKRLPRRLSLSKMLNAG